MLPTVQFDDEVNFKADEIGNVSSNGYLPEKFMTTEPIGAEISPQNTFGVGRVNAEMAGVGRSHVEGWIKMVGGVLYCPLSPRRGGLEPALNLIRGREDPLRTRLSGDGRYPHYVVQQP